MSIIGTIPNTNNNLRPSRRPPTQLSIRWIYYAIQPRLLIWTTEIYKHTSISSESTSNFCAIKRLRTTHKSLLVAFISPELQSYGTLPDSSNNINIGSCTHLNQYFWRHPAPATVMNAPLRTLQSVGITFASYHVCLPDSHDNINVGPLRPSRLMF